MAENKVHLIIVPESPFLAERLSVRLRNMGQPVTPAESREALLRIIQAGDGDGSNAIEGNGDGAGALAHIPELAAAHTSCIVISAGDLSDVSPFPPHSSDLGYHKTLAEIEREYIRETLRKCGWNIKTSAKLLGIDRSTLYRKIKKYGIVEPGD